MTSQNIDVLLFTISSST